MCLPYQCVHARDPVRSDLAALPRVNPPALKQTGFQLVCLLMLLLEPVADLPGLWQTRYSRAPVLCQECWSQHPLSLHQHIQPGSEFSWASEEQQPAGWQRSNYG